MPVQTLRERTERMTHHSAHDPSERRSFPGWRWVAAALAFPVAGYIGWKVGGRVDAVGAALVGGALTGAGLGAVEWWGLTARLGAPRPRSAPAPLSSMNRVEPAAPNTASAASAARGARVIYQALKPPYHRWGQEFPGLQAAAIAAAQAAGARRVVMDNVYMYGRANGRPFTEDRTYDAHTRKGRVRGRSPATS